MNASTSGFLYRSLLLVVCLAMTSACLAASPPKVSPLQDIMRQEQRDKEMLKLSPEARLEQRCNARAMGLVSREHKTFRIDEFVAYAYGDTIVHGDSMQAPGGAIRDGKVWYHLSYNCQTTDDRLGIKSFSYQLGAPIPRSEWDEHYLVPK